MMPVKAAEGITIIRWTIQPKKQGEAIRTCLLDASTPERAKAAWMMVFNTLDKAGAFEYLTAEKYKAAFRPESIANTMRQLFGTVPGAKLTFDGADTVLDYDGAAYRVRVTEERAPTETTSQGFLEWKQLCALYKEAKGGSAQAMVVLCMKQPGVVTELAETCKEGQ